jgi:hypothetical protein
LYMKLKHSQGWVSWLSFLQSIYFLVFISQGRIVQIPTTLNLWSSFVYQNILLMKFSNFHEIWYNNIIPPEVIPLFIL